MLSPITTEKFENLPDKTKEVLFYAAIFDTFCTLSFINDIGGYNPNESEKVIYFAIENGLILPIDHSENYFFDLENFELRYKIIHESIRKVAYDYYSSEQKKQIHLKIGRLLLDKLNRKCIVANIYAILSHFDKCSDLITDKTEKAKLVELYFDAGIKASKSGAFEHSYFYLTSGIELLEKNAWKENYIQTLKLYEEVTNAAFYNGLHKEVEYYSNCIFANSTELLDKIKTYGTVIKAHISLNKHEESLKTGLMVLKLLDVNIPDSSNKIKIAIGLSKTKILLRGKTIDDLLLLPKMTDIAKKAAMHILSLILSTTYFYVPELLPLIVFKLIKFSLKYGNTPESALGYSAYGLILCGILEKIEAGNKYG